jgi:flagellar biosynthesis repressor protein FlbT
MALKINLKPHERLIIGGAVISNGGARSTFLVENTVPILREKDIMSATEADSPCKRIYLAIQLMYVDEHNLAEQHRVYWELVKAVAEAAPSRKQQLAEISELVGQKQYYQALKLTKKLIEYEKEIIENVRNSNASIPNRSKNHDVRQGD